MRVDKWLWVTRFFKTRAQSQKEIELGRVRISGQKIKSSKELKIGDCLSIVKDQQEFQVKVLGFCESRVGFAIASTLYQEDEMSRQKREQNILLRRAQAAGMPRMIGRPTKKNRRSLDHLKWRSVNVIDLDN